MFSTFTLKNNKYEYKLKHLLIGTAFWVTVIAGILFVGRNYIFDRFPVFNVSFQVKDASIEQYAQFSFDIHKTQIYSIDLNMECHGFVSDIRITNDKGELVYQDLGDDLSHVTNVKLDKGSYSLGLHYITKEMDVKPYCENMGYKTLVSDDTYMGSLSKVFSNDDYNGVISIKLR